MPNLKRMEEEIQNMRTLQDMVRTYQEIAAVRMRKVKSSVLTNREYLAGLNEVFQQVRFAYKKSGKKSALRTNGKTVSVLLSSNTMLYGDIIKKTFDYFTDNIQKAATDIVIVGRVGLRLFKESKVSKPYKFFKLSDTGIDYNNLRALVDHIVQYESIHVFHGRFKDLLAQSPEKTLISDELLRVESGNRENQLKYIFEPSIEEVLAFFESQMLGTIFEQSVQESNLSKFASRMINLDYAVENIEKEVLKSRYRMQQAKHREFNSKQISVLSGMKLWGGK